MSSSHFVNAVSLPVFLADGFRLALAAPSQPHPAGGKRRRSPANCASTHDTTPSSEGPTETIESTHTEEEGEGEKSQTTNSNSSNNINNNNNNNAAADVVLLAPTATSLLRLEPSGSWLQPSLPGVRAGAAADVCSRAENSAELASLLRAALLDCHKTEDELLKRKWEKRAEVEEEERRSVCPASSSQQPSEEKTDPMMPHSASYVSSSSGAFERTVGHIHAQKRRRREQSERLETQAREVARVKELPLLVEDAVRYAEQLVAWSWRTDTDNNNNNNNNNNNSGSASHADGSRMHSDESVLDERRSPHVVLPMSAEATKSASKAESQMLYARFPPPLFRTSSFAAGVGRLLRWVRTWQRATPGKDVAETECKQSGKRMNPGNKTMSRQRVNENVNPPSRQGHGGKKKEGSGLLLGGDEAGEKGDKDNINGCCKSIRLENNKRKNNNNEEEEGVDAILKHLITLHRYHDNWIRMADRMVVGNNNINNNNNNGGSSRGCGQMLVPAPSKGSCSADPGEEAQYGLATDNVVYDEYGNRLRSVRMARKMAEKRALQEEARRARERRRGYFARAEEEGRLMRRSLFGDFSNSGSDVSSDDADDDVTNIAVLHGPCGVGKTAIVYLVAEILGYRVVEMNTSMRRCPKNIQRLFAEVTRSCRLSGFTTGGKVPSSVEDVGVKESKKENNNNNNNNNNAPATVVVPSAASHVSSAKGATKKGVKAKPKVAGITAEALAAFFRPRVQQPKSLEVILVDSTDLPAALATTTTEMATHPEKLVLENNNNNNNNNGNEDNRYIEVCDDKEEKNENMEAAINKPSGNSEDTTRTLLLFEDADVILGDEAMKPFYAAVRDLAQRSKVPIIVTVSSSATTNGNSNDCSMREFENAQTVPMDATQVAQFFGKQTPLTVIDPVSRSTLFMQLLVVAAVERRLITVQNCATPKSGEEKEGKNSFDKSRTITDSLMSPTTPQQLVLVNDVGKFQRLVETIRREVYDEVLGKRSGAIQDPADVRLWLNRLQYLLLEEQWPTSMESNNSTNEYMAGGEACILPTHLESWKDVMNVAGVKSHWDMQLGRLLNASNYVHPVTSSPWEWQQFQYAEEIAAIRNSCDVKSECGTGGDIRAGVKNNSSGDVVANLHPSGIYIPRGFTESLQEIIPDNACIHQEQQQQQQRERGEGPVDGIRGNCMTTTRQRIDAFGAWWRRTRKSEAIKNFVAARGAGAYEDLIGFGCLLQQSPLLEKLTGGILIRGE